MDPATLYMVITLADGSPRAREERFPSVEACETYVSEAASRIPEGATVVSAECHRHYRVSPAKGSNTGLYGSSESGNRRGGR